MYFLSQGNVVILNDDGQETATLNPGSYFGEIALLTSEKRTASVVALTFCDILMLTKDEFEFVLKKKKFQREREQINNVDKERIIRHRKQRLVKRLPLLSQSKPEFTEALASRLRYTTFQKGDYIIREKEIGTEMYFLDKGNAEAITADGTVLATIPEGGFFGEIAILYDCVRTASVVAVTPVDIFSLKREEFEQVLITFPAETDRIRKTAEARLTNLSKKKQLNNYKGITSKYGVVVSLPIGTTALTSNGSS